MLGRVTIGELAIMEYGYYYTRHPLDPDTVVKFHAALAPECDHHSLSATARRARILIQDRFGSLTDMPSPGLRGPLNLQQRVLAQLLRRAIKVLFFRN